MFQILSLWASIAFAVPHTPHAVEYRYTPVENPYVEWYSADTTTWPGPRVDGNSPLVWIGNTLTLFFNYWHQADERVCFKTPGGDGY